MDDVELFLFGAATALVLTYAYLWWTNEQQRIATASLASASHASAANAYLPVEFI